VARQWCGYPAGSIARLLGCRGHSRVRAAVMRIEAHKAPLKRTLAALHKELANA